jgi:hypothetical protein
MTQILGNFGSIADQKMGIVRHQFWRETRTFEKASLFKPLNSPYPFLSETPKLSTIKFRCCH